MLNASMHISRFIVVIKKVCFPFFQIFNFSEYNASHRISYSSSTRIPSSLSNVQLFNCFYLLNVLLKISERDPGKQKKGYDGRHV
jgi:hypothetical protein